MIEEAIITEVCIGDNNGELQIRYSDDVLEFYLDGKEIFGGDWTNNFANIFKRALELWEE